MYFHTCRSMFLHHDNHSPSGVKRLDYLRGGYIVSDILNLWRMDLLCHENWKKEKKKKCANKCYPLTVVVTSFLHCCKLQNVQQHKTSAQHMNTPFNSRGVQFLSSIILVVHNLFFWGGDLHSSSNGKPAGFMLCNRKF